MIDFFKRFMAKPVLAWFAIVLLATIVLVPPTYVFASGNAAWIVGIIGSVIAINIGIIGMARDYFSKRATR